MGIVRSLVWIAGAVEFTFTCAWRNRLIVTVDPSHAKFNRSTPVALAGFWRRHLATALSP